MSGGVDSSVAAAMLVEAGHEVVGATMKTFCYSDEEVAASRKTCCGLEGIQDARQVADRLGVPHYVFDVEREFTRDVIDDFVAEYGRGRTPNPCVRCNSNTKFRDLLRRGRVLGCDGVASGHYVRLDRSGGEPRLLRGADRAKDQSYFLWGLPAELLGKLHFPLGELTKPEVRERARAHIDDLFAEYELDGIASLANLFSGTYAAAGYPAITVPAGLADRMAYASLTGGEGSPFGLTFTGRLFEDAEVIGYAYAFEQASLLRRVPLAAAGD
jgi:hypothetical protein